MRKVLPTGICGVLGLLFFVVAAGVSAASSDQPMTHLACQFRSAPATDAYPAQTHHIQLEFEGENIVSVLGPTPVCAGSGTDFVVSESQVTWSCSEDLNGGQIFWTGYINRFTMRYDVRGSITRHPDRTYIMRGVCEITERQF
jgi:hypothetical protein